MSTTSACPPSAACSDPVARPRDSRYHHDDDDDDYDYDYDYDYYDDDGDGGDDDDGVVNARGRPKKWT